MDPIAEIPEEKKESRYARYYKNNTERCTKIQREYYYRTAEKRRAYQRAYYQRKKAEKLASKE
jgi:hypothetical protein